MVDANNERALRGSLGALLLIVLGAAICEASATVPAVYAAKPLIGATLVAWLLVFGLSCLAGLPIAWGLAGLVDTATVQQLAKHMVAAFGGERARSSIALLSLLIAFGVALITGMLVGNALVEHLSPSFAAAGTTVVTLLTLVACAPPLAWFGHWFDRVVDFKLAYRSWTQRVSGVSLVVLLTGFVTCAALAFQLGASYAALPGGAVFALAAASTRPVRKTIAKWLGTTARGAALTVGLWVACAPAALFASAAPPSAQAGALFKAPYLSVVVASVERSADGDGDGYAPILFGKDCDDADPQVHPGALEIPDNEVDEDCSGADVAAWKPIPTPPLARPSQLPEKMNILLIMVDALRPDRLHFAGYDRPTSPNLDGFRERATWFKNAFTTAPLTRDALASLLTGKYPFRIGIKRSPGLYTLPDNALTFAEVLHDAGYENIGYTITYVDRRFRNYGQGFTSFEAPWGPKPWQYEWKRAAPLTTKAGLAKLETLSTEQPWLMFLHYRCTHDPYYTREKDFGDRNSDKYDSSLHHCDHHIAKVLSAAESRQDAERTAIFIFSDHGELFGEHGGKYHGETLFEPDVRTVLLAKVPGSDQRTVETPVNLADLAPTVLSLAGAEIPKGTNGWNLLPLMFNTDVDPAWQKRPLFVTTELERAGIRYTAAAAIDFPFKYIWDMRTGMKELFDVVKDPLERTPLDDPQRQSQMAELLDQWLASNATKRVKSVMTKKKGK